MLLYDGRDKKKEHENILTANFMLFVEAKYLYGAWIVCNKVAFSANHTCTTLSLSDEITRLESIKNTAQVMVALWFWNEDILFRF